ncbi:MAG: hypothetical protein AABY05_01930 [Nanoarchaeota archaeon]
MKKKTLAGIIAGCLGVLAGSECHRVYSEEGQHLDRIYGYMSDEHKTKYDSTGYYILGAGLALGGFVALHTFRKMRKIALRERENS